MSLRHGRALDEPDLVLAEQTLELARYEWAAGLLHDALRVVRRGRRRSPTPATART